MEASRSAREAPDPCRRRSEEDSRGPLRQEHSHRHGVLHQSEGDEERRLPHRAGREVPRLRQGRAPLARRGQEEAEGASDLVQHREDGGARDNPEDRAHPHRPDARPRMLHQVRCGGVQARNRVPRRQPGHDARGVHRKGRLPGHREDRYGDRQEGASRGQQGDRPHRFRDGSRGQGGHRVPRPGLRRVLQAQQAHHRNGRSRVRHASEGRRATGH